MRRWRLLRASCGSGSIMILRDEKPLATAPSVPSPLAGQGQGEGCHTTCRLLFGDSFPSRERFHRTPFAGPPLSPALLRNGGGRELCSRPDGSAQHRRTERCVL